MQIDTIDPFFRHHSPVTKELGKSGTGTATGIFRVKAGQGRGSRLLGKGIGTGFFEKGGTRLYMPIWFKGRDWNKAGKRIS